MILMAAYRINKSHSRKISEVNVFILLLTLVLLLSGLAAEGVSAGDAFPGNQEAVKFESSSFQVPSLQDRVSQALAPVPRTGLDPHYSWEQNRSYLLSELYYFLFEYDHHSQEIKPQLAADLPAIEQDEEGRKKYIFKISSGYRFASGREIEARDVKYSLLRLLILDAPDSGSGYLWQTIFGVSSLEEFIERQFGYGSPETLSSEEAQEVFSRLTEHILIQEDDKLTVKPARDYDLTYLLSDLVPWAAVVDLRAVKNLGGWDGRAETWAFYHRTRVERHPPLQESNEAGRYELQVINFQPARLINLQKIADSGERAGITAVFDPRRRAGVEMAIKDDIYDFIQLTPSQQERYRHMLKDSSILERKLLISDSKIYLTAGEKYLKEKSEVKLIYYRENQEHRKLAQQVMTKLEAEEVEIILEGLDWQSYTARLFRGDFELAVMEWFQPFPEDIIPPFLTAERHLSKDVEIVEELEKTWRYLYGELK